MIPWNCFLKLFWVPKGTPLIPRKSPKSAFFIDLDFQIQKKNAFFKISYENTIQNQSPGEPKTRELGSNLYKKSCLTLGARPVQARPPGWRLLPLENSIFQAWENTLGKMNPWNCFLKLFCFPKGTP